MLEFFQHIVFWHWLCLGAVLLIFEMVTGSGFLFWIGISAGIIGGILWFFPEMNWMTQMLGFAGLSLVLAFLWWAYQKRYPTRTDQPRLNRRAQQYVGRVFTLESAVVNGFGTIRVDDSSWRVKCKELPMGARVRIVGVDGVILIGEEVDLGKD